MNLSAKGVFLATPAPAPVGAPVTFGRPLPLAAGPRTVTRRAGWR